MNKVYSAMFLSIKHQINRNSTVITITDIAFHIIFENMDTFLIDFGEQTKKSHKTVLFYNHTG